ncbi:MAG: choice-of-anchor N protein [Candidatus Methylomirabilis sp.]|nr:choice-of-anchor N protein [Deltaproteobacteria bacterium]
MLSKLKYVLSTAVAASFLGLAPSISHALPALQLDIEGGSYDYSTKTIVANDDVFTLYAFLNPSRYNDISDLFYLSIAVLPSLEYSDEGASLGSFTINGAPINVTSDMSYGTPPVDETYLKLAETNDWDIGDLEQHEVFPTYFYEYGFYFNENDMTQVYDTMYRAMNGFKTYQDGQMYYAAFSIDTRLLDPEYVIHFDFYNSKVKKTGDDVDITMFAKFSYDAESRKVPEPGTLILLGSGLVGAYLHGRLRRRKS